MDNLSFLGKAGSARFLITLLENGDSLPNTKLLNISKIYSSTFYDRKDDLLKSSLIEIQEKLSKDEDGNIKGSKIWISLTPKGKKVAEKLKEIKEIMEREE